MIHAAWAILATLIAPALRPYLRMRARRNKEIAARLAERRGIDHEPRPAGRVLWMHAASVGETESILPVLVELHRQAPMTTVLLTTGTVTSAELLGRRLPGLGLERHVVHRFAPLDVPAWVRRFLDHWKPDAACFVESELWPNRIAACRRRGIPLMLINARMSAGSFAWWRRVPRAAERLLSAFDTIRARSEEDAQRLRDLGGRSAIRAGDLKFAAPPLPADTAELDALRARIGDRPVWLAASTHPGEEALIADAHRLLAVDHPGLLTIVAPRHPDRGSAIARELGDAPRRAAGDAPPAGGLWIADTLGELGLWFRLAPIVFVGRSLLPPGGGQNPLEPARLGCAILTGPHTGNFTDHHALLRSADAVIVVHDASSLAESVGSLLRDPARGIAMGQRAAAIIGGHEGLPAETAAALLASLR